jgi:hypothetical protein
MKVDCPRCQVVAGADAGEDAVDRADRRRAAGTKLPMQASSTISAFWRM